VVPDYVEKVVRFGEDERLSGITTQPALGPGEDGGIWCILPNSGIVPRSGVARLHVRLARALAAIGVSTLRFDLSGLGDSERSRDGSDPLSQAQRDLEAARSFVRAAMNARGDVIAGLCSGAHDAVQSMRTSSGCLGLVAIDLIAEYKSSRQVMEHYRSRLLRPASWGRALANPGWAADNLAKRLRGERTGEAEPAPSDWIGVRPIISQDELRAGLRTGLEHGMELLFLFSGGLEENYTYADQFAEAFPDESESSQVEYRFFPDAGHIFDDVEQQNSLIEAICSWMDSRLPQW
jgi:hypothetical protein